MEGALHGGVPARVIALAVLSIVFFTTRPKFLVLLADAIELVVSAFLTMRSRSSFGGILHIVYYS